MDDPIAGLELAAAAHWRGTQEERLGDWLLRAAGGFTGRANSALAVGDPGMPLEAATAAVTAWYRARGLPPMIAVPMPLAGEGSPPPRPGQDLDHFLAKRNWATRPGPAFVMTAEAGTAPGPLSGPALSAPALSLPPGTALRMDAEPDEAWLAMYHYRGRELPAIARTLLMSAPWQCFASIRDEAGAALAIARVSAGGGWAGITAVEVSAARRRQGLGTLITRAACAQAARRGPTQVFLQVETNNTGAQALYASCGFRYSHRYHYRCEDDHDAGRAERQLPRAHHSTAWASIRMNVRPAPAGSTTTTTCPPVSAAGTDVAW
jgi:ribosomal protein S18 acetylase RimI-like enzyme